MIKAPVGNLPEPPLVPPHGDHLRIGKLDCRSPGLRRHVATKVAQPIVIGNVQWCAEDRPHFRFQEVYRRWALHLFHGKRGFII